MDKINNKTFSILDTTLREGEQTPYVSFTVDEKLNLVKKLDDFGVEMIEAGHPVVSNKVYEAVKRIANENLKAEVLAHVRALKSDINRAIECDVDRVAIFLPTSNIHLKDKMKMSRKEILERIIEMVEYARSHGMDVRFTSEDATRSNTDYVINACEVAVEAGADRISIADTVGIATPESFYAQVKTVIDNVKAEVDVHCHNDLGLGLANALAGIRAGATCVHVTVNGLGERCGIVDLASISVANNIILQNKNKYKLDMLPEISHYVEKISGIFTMPTDPIIGRHAFMHKSGVHTDGVIKNPQTYEAYSPSLVGGVRKIVIDKYTGKLAVKKKLDEYGIDVNEDDLIKIVEEIKILGDERKIIHETEILEVVERISGKTGIIVPTGIEALLMVRLHSNIYTTSIVRKISSINGVNRILEIAGDDDIGTYISVNDVARLNDLVEEIRAIPGVSSTNTRIVLKKFGNNNGNPC